MILIRFFSCRQFNKLTSIEPGLLSNGNETLSSRISFIDLGQNRINCEYIFVFMLLWFWFVFIFF